MTKKEADDIVEYMCDNAIVQVSKSMIEACDKRLEQLGGDVVLAPGAMESLRRTVK